MIKFLLTILMSEDFWALVRQWFKKSDRDGIKDAYKKAHETRDPKHISDYVNNRSK